MTVPSPVLSTEGSPPASEAFRARRSRRSLSEFTRALGVGITAGLLSLVVLIAALAIVVPFVTGSHTYTILTQSMEPAYPPGTLVVVRPVDPEELLIGDAITYQVAAGEQTVITHRVVAVTRSTDGGLSFTTMGDNNAVADPAPVIPEQIRGRVWYALPWIGTISVLRQSPASALILPLIGGAFIVWGIVLVVSWLIQRARRSRADVPPGSSTAEPIH